MTDEVRTPVLLHVFADEKGQTHLRRVALPLSAGTATRPFGTVETGLRIAGDDYKPGWHRSPARRFALTIFGEFEVEMSDGSRHPIKPGDLVFLDDVAGDGHRTIPSTGRLVHLYLNVSPDFDLEAWIQSLGMPAVTGARN